MATVKQYVDLAGLTTFSTSLKKKLAANTLNDWVVNYASNAGQATSDGNGANIAKTYLTQTDATATYVPLTREIAGKALSSDISKEGLLTALNVADGAQVNVIEKITIKDGVEQSVDPETKTVTLNLDAYAKKTEIAAVLKFMGVVTGVDKLPTANKDSVGHVYIIATNNENDAYAEYVCVDTNGDTEGGYAWEKLGNGTALVDYYTKDEIDTKITLMALASTGAEGKFISLISQENGKVSASATAFATSVDENGKVAPTSGAVYTAIEGAKSALIGTGAGDTGSTIKKNEAAIATLNGADTVEGSVAKKIKDVISGLTGTQSEGDYVTSVTQTDGKIAVTKASKGSVADGNTGLVDGGTVHSFVTTHVTKAIQGLDVDPVGGDGSFLSAISEADGKISATVKTLDATIPDSNPSTVVAPTTSAFKDYSDSVYVAISSVSSEEISQLFILESLVSKTRELISRTIEVAESDSVTSIGAGAFTECSSLTSISFPVATSIGDDAFTECSSLTSVSVPKATSIGTSAFYKCSALTNIDSPLVTSLGTSAFGNCSALTSVLFPVATSVGNAAFYNCSALTSVSFPEATSAGYQTFAYCSKLTSVSIPKATIIDYQAFAVCKSLTSIDSPLATSIGKQAFADCSSLTSVSFPVATSIGQYAFESCSSLTEVSFPKATSIEGYAFYNCSNLTTIYVGKESDTVCTLSNTNAFNNCTNLANIYVPESLVDSYKSATNWSNYADKIKVDIQPVECIALSITADDVAIGNATSTTVHYTAECTYTKEGILQEGTRVFKGKATSNSFEKNTSPTDTVQREVSFTFLGQTATTTITQGVWINPRITVTTPDLSDYGWVTADSIYNVDGYDVYMSNNQGVNSSNAVMKLECVGYTELTIYIRSYAESSYDYTIASIANASTYPTSSSSSDTKAHTSGNQNSGTKLSDYTKVEYTGLSGKDIIYIVFRKDSGGANGDDRGYVLISKQA